MPKDHYVPKAYLRGFTPGYLAGKKDGVLFQYYPLVHTVERLSINDYVACEPDFYANHPIDKHWSKTIEQKWPWVRAQLKDCQSNDTLLDELLWFASAQIMRTPTFMNRVAQNISAERAIPQTITDPDGTKWTGRLFDMVHTDDVMAVVAGVWPRGRRAFQEQYAWKLCHNSSERNFLTSDNPCRWDMAKDEVTMPVALDMVLIGTRKPKGTEVVFHHTKADSELVGKVNRATVAACDSWVYAQEDTPELRRFMVKNYPRPKIGDPTGRKFTTRLHGRP